MPEGLVERYDERIAGVLSCYGRIVIAGTLPGICHAKGMTAFLYANAIRIFDYPQFAATLRDKVRENTAKRRDLNIHETPVQAPKRSAGVFSNHSTGAAAGAGAT